MLDIVMTFDNGEQRVTRVNTPLVIGRSIQCGLRVPGWRVARQHARLSGPAQALVLEDMGSMVGTRVNGCRITVYQPVCPDDVILIGSCRLHVRPVHSRRASGADTRSSRPLLSSTPSGAPAQDAMSGVQEHGERAGVRSAATSSEHCVTVQAGARPIASSPGTGEVDGDVADTLSHRKRLHAGLLQALNLRRLDVAGMSDASLRREAQALLATLATDDPSIPAHVDRVVLCREVLDEAVGLGPLEPLLADPGISEIMVNRYDEIYVERQGRLCRHRATFSSEQSVRWVIERIVTPVGRRIDESAPMVDARLADGSRVNAVIPPIALRGASLTIRKFPLHRPQMQDLIQTGGIDAAMARFLILCVRTRKNIVVAGGTGSGKTTLLNILSDGIPEDERIITIEDAAELRLSHEHVVALEARPANQENRGRIDIRELVRNALRMRPDRIVVGECRGAEAFDMLTAMNTGHEGSLSTLHANSPRDALSRMEAMVLMAGMDLPVSVVREHIGASIDIVVQQVRLSDGRRVTSSIVEITGMESGRIQLQELFRYQGEGNFQACGLLPSFVDEWRAGGVDFDIDLFALGRR